MNHYKDDTQLAIGCGILAVAVLAFTILALVVSF